MEEVQHHTCIAALLKAYFLSILTCIKMCSYLSFLEVGFADLIIFSCVRFQVKKKQFFRNFMTIILFGAIGTLISFGIISLGIFIQQL